MARVFRSRREEGQPGACNFASQKRRRFLQRKALDISMPLDQALKPILAPEKSILQRSDRILITGAAGFVGTRVLVRILEFGFTNIVCFVRSSSKVPRVEAIVKSFRGARVDIVVGNLLSKEDCETACRGVKVIFHLAAGTGGKSYPDAFLNSVIATRNLLHAWVRSGAFRRFVLVSSFAVYSNRQRENLLDESSPIEPRPERREAYCYAKVRQEEIVEECAKKYGFEFVTLRPGSIYGPGQKGITGRVGLGTFGLFLHLGGSNQIPFTHVDNCAAAIALSGMVEGIDGEAFNVVDDDLPSSRQFLREYKRHVRRFRSLYIPHACSYLLCRAWEKYSRWSQGQLPPAFTTALWYSQWRKTNYSNRKLKERMGWYPETRIQTGLEELFGASLGHVRNA